MKTVMKPDEQLLRRRGRTLRAAMEYIDSGEGIEQEAGRFREKLCRAIVKATTPGRQTQKQIVELERRAQKAFGDVCRRAAR